MKKTSQPNWSLSSIKVMQNCQSCMYGSFQSTMVCTFHLCLWSIRTLYAISEIPKIWKYFYIKIYNVVQYKINQNTPGPFWHMFQYIWLPLSYDISILNFYILLYVSIKFGEFILWIFYSKRKSLELKTGIKERYAI